MPKLKNPPQGGEQYLCLTLFCTMMLSVMSAVAIIYAIVIVYVPSKKVLESNLTGPKMCTTLSMQKDLVGVEICDGWTSCVEWCLSKVSWVTRHTKPENHQNILLSAKIKDLSFIERETSGYSKIRKT